MKQRRAHGALAPVIDRDAADWRATVQPPWDSHRSSLPDGSPVGWRTLPSRENPAAWSARRRRTSVRCRRHGQRRNARGKSLGTAGALDYPGFFWPETKPR